MDVKEVLVPILEVQRNLPPEVTARSKDNYIKLTKVDLSVAGVLKAYDNPDSLTFYFRQWVRAPRLLRKDANVVVGVYWNEDFLEGNYEIHATEGIYIQDGEEWVSQGEVKGGRRHTLAKLREIIDSVDIEHISKEADAVFIGRVLAVKDSIYRGKLPEYGSLREIRLRVERPVEGTAPNEVTVMTVAKGTYWPDWQYIMPKHIAVGDVYYVFFKEDEGISYVLGGVNGFYKIAGDQLLYNDQIVVPFNEAELSARVREIKKSANSSKQLRGHPETYTSRTPIMTRSIAPYLNSNLR